jgi:DNA-binding transcriptional ArsR family regulator
MLLCLVGGLRVPAGELAAAAGVSPSTGSEHLRILVDAGLVRVEPLGRHRYYSLAGDDVARAIEALQAVSPGTPVRSLRQDRVARELREGRTCYDHLAGDLGLRVTDLLLTSGVLPALEPGRSVEPPEPLPAHDVVARLDLAAVRRSARRPWARGCLDWTGRRLHVAGAVGDHVLTAFRSNGWVETRPGSRAVRLTATGEAALSSLER